MYATVSCEPWQMNLTTFLFFVMSCFVLSYLHRIGSVQIEESGGTAFSFAADISCETEVESMMRTVSWPSL
jgi:hypothetical protein